MSKLCDIQNIYGQSVAFAIANATVSDVLSSNNLPSNTIIITSPQKDDVDNGLHEIVITDNNSNPIQLTYTVLLGNGLNYDSKGDYVFVNIDNNTIVDTNSELDINLNTLIDNKTVKLQNNKLYIDINDFPITSSTVQGVAKIDDNTIKTNQTNEKKYVETSNLTHASNNVVGIVKGDNSTISITNGIISVNTNNLKHAEDNKLGLIKPDNKTIIANDGVISVNTNNLEIGTSDKFGIGQVDGRTIISNNGLISATCVDVCEYNKPGFVMCDKNSIQVNNGIISIKNANQINNRVDNIRNNISTIEDAIKNPNIININGVKNNINKFICNTHTVSVLPRSKYGVFPDTMNYENLYADFIINTSIPFTIQINITNNVEPALSILSVTYDGREFIGDSWKNIQFASTQEIDKIMTLKFICKNFADAVLNSETIITNIDIDVVSTKSVTEKRNIIYGVVRYNSLFINTINKPVVSTAYDGTLFLKDNNLQVDKDNIVVYNEFSNSDKTIR